MRVRELVDKLIKYPQDSTVFIWDENDERELDIVNFISLKDAGYLEISVK